MPDYYKINNKTTANSTEFMVDDDAVQSFPKDGFCVGMLRGNGMQIPALVDFKETKGLCFLYHSPETKAVVNRCVERLLWRVAVSTPSKLCDFLIYNGGNPGEMFNTVNLLNDKLFTNKEKLYFSGNENKFS